MCWHFVSSPGGCTGSGAESGPGERSTESEAYISRAEAIKVFDDYVCDIPPMEAIDEIRCLPAVDAEPVITGETSDGYHTFNELYHHRAVLFSVIVKAFPERAWKARQHHDGTMYGGMFIVGIDTPEGQASYHYDIDPYWDMFECRELERAPEWDGHTPAQAIERIRKLEPVRHGRWLHTDGYPHLVYCSCCYRTIITNAELMYRYEIPTNFCPNCGAKMSDGGLANGNN